ncbi:hypothetical protein AVEN_24119-1 [Araneus ventricosus]|uniref:Uncharacterized protein n=1 Tax=Araneus ventricosus TaxID=182803 RepID=A0A4Y2PIC2_ARAVE|nr:hypothetical protein AVEN_24119-1 [Araneus ventricosus]
MMKIDEKIQSPKNDVTLLHSLQFTSAPNNSTRKQHRKQLNSTRKQHRKQLRESSARNGSSSDVQLEGKQEETTQLEGGAWGGDNSTRGRGEAGGNNSAPREGGREGRSRIEQLEGGGGRSRMRQTQLEGREKAGDNSTPNR